MKQNKFNVILLVVIYNLSLHTAPLMAQLQVTVSPFYSDFTLITDSLPSGWTPSLFIQVSVDVTFPPHTSLDELREYKFEKYPMYHELLWKFVPVQLRYGEQHWDNLSLLDWNKPPINAQDKEEIQRGEHRFHLRYNYPSFIGGTMMNQNNIPSISYIHNEDWESLFPRAHQRDSVEVIFNVNSSLFELLVDAKGVNLYGKKSIVISPKNTAPSFYLFYRPVYQKKEIQHSDIAISLIEEDTNLVKKIVGRIAPHLLSQGNTSNGEILTDGSIKLLTNSMIAIERLLKGIPHQFSQVKIVKSGLNIGLRMGEKGKESYFRAKFSLQRGGFLILDNQMYNSHTLIHELLHLFLPSIICRQHKGKQSTYEEFFFNESIIEYLAKYLYGKEIVVGDMFLCEKRRLNAARLKEARKKLLSYNGIGVEPEDSETLTLSTSEIYYDILPCLLHQMALQTGKSEYTFAQALVFYIQDYHENQASAKHLFSYLRRQGFKIKEQQLQILLSK